LLPHTAPTVGHVEPLPVQTSLMQQPPELHAFGAQHGWPGLPHCVQTPLLQTSFASHARPGQHAWPGAPHDWQTPPTQAPAVQLLLLQQAAPSWPHDDELVFLPQPVSASATTKAIENLISQASALANSKSAANVTMTLARPRNARRTGAPCLATSDRGHTLAPSQRCA
jgi:hypothetical protein